MKKSGGKTLNFIGPSQLMIPSEYKDSNLVPLTGNPLVFIKAL